MSDNEKTELRDKIIRTAAAALFIASGLLYAFSGTNDESETYPVSRDMSVYSEQGRSVIGEQQQMEKDEADAPLHININSDDIAELTRLPGIGEKRAGDIIEYRKEHGDFVAPEDIMLVKGIKGGTYEKIKDFIYIEEDNNVEEDSGG